MILRRRPIRHAESRKRSSTRQIIPVTEIEAGLTAHITCNSSITTGYLFSAWHDLGFRDEFNFSPTLLETQLRRRRTSWASMDSSRDWKSRTSRSGFRSMTYSIQR